MKRILIAILIFIPANIISQISGIVIDKSSGYPLEYATIRVENENTGTLSDIKGKFTLKKNVLNKTLVISAIGFTTERVVARKEFMSIELKSRVYQLGEVFITAERKKAEFVIDRYKKDSAATWYSRKTGSPMVEGSQMDSLRPGPNLVIFQDSKTRLNNIY